MLASVPVSMMSVLYVDAETEVSELHILLVFTSTLTPISLHTPHFPVSAGSPLLPLWPRLPLLPLLQPFPTLPPFYWFPLLPLFPSFPVLPYYHDNKKG